ncbi:MAG: class I SAM-dependent methyltransferase [Bacteroidetes bacterium]|nr:MAG: class I SAM-dependent methyltransferase [Bacteroidota bacterium]
MSCCQSCSLQGTNDFFSSQSKRYLKTFHKKGLGKEQKYLLEGIATLDIQGCTALEVGCGVGGLHLTLMQHGVDYATGIDISEGMIAGARQLARELGLEKRVTYHVGDIVNLNEHIREADIVLLDKVVCCYEQVLRLIEVSSKKSVRVFAFTYPNPNFLVKISFKGLIALGVLLKWKFRPYWHDWNALLHTLETYGFTQTYNNSTIMWNICVMKRVK